MGFVPVVSKGPRMIWLSGPLAFLVRVGGASALANSPLGLATLGGVVTTPALRRHGPLGQGILQRQYSPWRMSFPARRFQRRDDGGDGNTRGQ